MIDPNLVTNYARDDDELLEFWLFCLFVRGKNANVQALKLAQFVDLCRQTPNKWISLTAGLYQKRDHVDGMLRSVKAGQYDTLTAAIVQTVERVQKNPDFLRSASARNLEDIHGVGPKTARYFILHTRPKARVAALDTHILDIWVTVPTCPCQAPHPPESATPNLKKLFFSWQTLRGWIRLPWIWQYGRQVEKRITPTGVDIWRNPHDRSRL